MSQQHAAALHALSDHLTAIINHEIAAAVPHEERERCRRAAHPNCPDGCLTLASYIRNPLELRYTLEHLCEQAKAAGQDAGLPFLVVEERVDEAHEAGVDVILRGLGRGEALPNGLEPTGAAEARCLEARRKVHSLAVTAGGQTTADLPSPDAVLEARPTSAPFANVPPVAPSDYLTTWSEIVLAVGKRNNEEDKNTVRRLCAQYEGPIVFPGQGKQPLVEKGKLLAWWNGIVQRAAELLQRKADAQETVSGTYQYGHGKTRDETVVPEIKGHIRRRKRPKS